MHGTEANMTDPTDRPGVLVLPPLLYLAALVTALVLQWFVPITLPLPLLVRCMGGILLVAGVAFGGAGRRAFTKAGTNVNPMQPATVIVSSGAYRVSRNPMYVGMAVALFGLAILTRIGWLLVVLLPVLVTMHWGVIRREERYLERKFGAEYLAFRSRVRRYL
jgi:protein-S-isoprenylcysteine O-methyltransferase Ste14